MKIGIKGACLFLFIVNININLYSQRLFSSSNNVAIKFIVFGHSYGVLNSVEKRNLLFNAINKEKPDYVFVLGDCDIYNDTIYSEYISSIESEIFFSPGNHDLTNDVYNDYIEKIGYLNKTIIDSSCNFILFNSSESVDEGRLVLEKALKEIVPENPTVLLTHHRIWDDNLLSTNPYSHDKSYLFSEITRTKINKYFNFI
jgi:predicted MPP superfamily phosphohydrolase